MSNYTQEERGGIRKPSAVVTVAAAATPEVLYQQSNSGGVNRTVILRKIMAYSNVGNCVVDIGNGLGGAFARIIPSFLVPNGIDTEWAETEIPEVEVNADLTVQSSILGCQIQVEVEEIGT